MNHILKSKDNFASSEQRDKSFTQTIDEVWVSKRKLNDKRAKLIRASMILYFSALFIAVLSVIIYLIKIIMQGG